MNPADINRRIAEEVMGWTWSWDGLDGRCWYDGDQPTEYGQGGSTMAGAYRHDFRPRDDERDCHRALEKMREKGWNVVWMVGNIRRDHRVEMWQNERWYVATGPTFTAAACDAILKAIEKD